MRRINTQLLSSPNYLSVNGAAVDASQFISSSFYTYFGDTQATGTIKLQASNDIPPAGTQGQFSPSNWVNIPNQSATITAGINTGAPALFTLSQKAYRWIRPVWTATNPGTQQIRCLPAGYGQAQIITIICNSDVGGNLNSTYFVFYSTHNANAYYLWYSVNGAGIDPALPGKIGIKVDIATNATDVTIAAASAAAVTAQESSVFSSIDSTGEIIISNLTLGTANDPIDGAGVHATGFAISNAVPGIDILSKQIPNSSYLFVDAALADGATKYYLWMNLDGTGTDPMIPGRTGIEIDFFDGDDANALAVSIQLALQTFAPEFAHITVPSSELPGSNVVTFSNVSTGSFIPAKDINTGFVCTISPITVNMDALSD